MNLETATNNQDPSNHNLPSSNPPDQDPPRLAAPDTVEPDQLDQGQIPLRLAAPDAAEQDQPDQALAAPDMAEQDQPAADEDEDGTSLSEYLENGYDYKTLKRGDIRSGIIIDTNDHGLVVDVGYKREGFVPAEDLTRLDEETRAEIVIGMNVPVFVLRPENRDGHPILSIHQAHMYKDWIEAEEMMASGKLYEGEVAGYNRGGLIVKYGKIRGFVPASQIVGLPKRLREEQRHQRMDAMIGQKIGLRIIEVDRQRRRLIFSQRRALRVWQEMQRDRVMTELVKGETRHGQVTSITNFGAFVDLGGADGLIHVSELSWGRVDNPREVLKVGDEIDVYVLDVDQQRKRIALSLKKLQPDPWTIVDDHYQGGQLVEGRVTRVLDFGAFIELDIGIEGLLHASEMIGTPELAPSDILRSGEKLLVKIIRIDSRRKRLALSARQVRKSEWERWVAEQQTPPAKEEAAPEEKTVEEAAAPEAEAEASAATETEQAVTPVEEAVEEAAAPEAEAEASAATEPEQAVTPVEETVKEAAALEAEAEASEATETEQADTPEEEATPTDSAGEETEATTESPVTPEE